MRGVYSVATTVTTFTSGDILSIESASTEIVELLELHVEVQDPTSGEDLDIEINRCTVNPTGGAATPAVKPDEAGDQASGSTVRTVPTGETQEADPIYRRGYPVETGWHYLPIPEQRKYVEPGGSIVITCNTTITSSTLVVYAEWREIG